LPDAAACTLSVRARQGDGVRRIGLFMPGTADDAEYQLRNAAFLQALGELGCTKPHYIEEVKS
jgi:DNA-binding LacI/PurR family transcriptional regulator